MKKRILIVEDDEIMRITIRDALNKEGFETSAYDNGREGMNALNSDNFSLVITDIRLPDMLGLDILKTVKEQADHIPVMVMTAYGTIKDAVEAMKLGAFDYITKPFSLDEFTLIVKRALEIKDLKDENIRLKRDLSDCLSYPGIIGESEKMAGIFALVDQVARTDSTILITGESGTGKELIVSAIHYQSKRSNGSLIKVNCAAFPEHLVESELFGYEKGAFTGATRTKPGRFERADRGTIFLDEIGDLPQTVQTKILRVLQDGSFERLGGTHTVTVDARIIAATNRNIQEDVKNGIFREDLYYRLNVIPIHLPPLRERKDDIPLLIEHFLGIYNCRSGKKVRMQPEAIVLLMEYELPGNVRELENIIERCVTLSVNGLVSTECLPPHIINTQNTQSTIIKLNKVASEAERIHIVKILKVNGGNKTKTANMLGISRKSLWEKMKAYGIV